MSATTHPKRAGKRGQQHLFSEEVEFALAGPGEKEDGPTLFTIGHSTRRIEELLEALARHGIERLADIRTYPNSRHNPQFNQPALQATLEARGIEYVWLKQLGGYREEGYLAYMETADFTAGVERLDTLASEKRTACMCAELKWYQCHRRYVADALSDRGWRVVHILDETRAEAHRPKANPDLV